MKIRSSLKPDEPLLVGDLVILDSSSVTPGPHLGVKVWCPYCKRDHNHNWFDPPFRLDSVRHCTPHCGFGGFGDGGYFVGLAPSSAEGHRRVIRRARDGPTPVGK